MNLKFLVEHMITPTVLEMVTLSGNQSSAQLMGHLKPARWARVPSMDQQVCSGIAT